MKITWITSVLNDAKAVGKTKRSIRISHARAKQTLSGPIDSEHIIVDGGSKASQIDLLETYADAHTLVLNGPDNGIYEAWNKGLAVASGDWIGFLGAGDMLLPEAERDFRLFFDMYNRQRRQAGPLELISGRVRKESSADHAQIVGGAWDWKCFRRHMNIAHVGALHSVSLFERYGCFDESFKVAGDYELLLRSGENLRAAFVDHVVATMASGGVSQTYRSALFRETRLAKARHTSRPRALLLTDDFWARSKFLVRRGLEINGWL